MLGFIPGITTHYDEMSFAGHSGALLFGLFAVSVLHNLVHLLFGALGLGAGMILLGIAMTAKERARSDSPVN